MSKKKSSILSPNLPSLQQPRLLHPASPSLSPSIAIAAISAGVPAEKAQPSQWMADAKGPQAAYLPSIMIEAEKNLRGMDLVSYLLEQRIVLVEGEVNSAMALSVRAQLLFLEGQSSKDPIKMYINSPGGDVYAGLAIYDTMQFISCPIQTCVNGIAMSMGSVLACAGQAGERYATPNSTIMIHSAAHGVRGKMLDIDINQAEGKRLYNTLCQIYHKHTGIPASEMAAFMDNKDIYLDPEQARKMRLIDSVVVARHTTEADNDKPGFRAPEHHVPKEIRDMVKAKANFDYIKDLPKGKRTTSPPARGSKSAGPHPA